MDKYRVNLTDEERDSLVALLTKGKTAARKLAHARILLLAVVGQDDEAIAETVAVSTRTVGRGRKRLVTEGFLAALDHKPQPPRPDKVKIKGDVEQELVRLACSDPPDRRCHWTLQLLADELVALGRLQTVSTETVRQALKSRHRPVGGQDVVYSAGCGWGVRLAHGGHDPDILTTVQCSPPGGVLR
jgi:transposase